MQRYPDDEALALVALQDQLAQARQNGDQQVEQELHLHLAQEWLRLKRYDSAQQAYSEAYVLTLFTRDESARLRALLGQSRYYLRARQPQPTKGLLEEGLDLARKQGNREAEVDCLSCLAHVALLDGDPRRATSLAEQARAILRAWGDQGAEAEALTLLAAAYAGLGHFEQAVSLHQQAILLAREWRDSTTEATHLANLGLLQVCELAQPEQGVAALHKALALFQEQGDEESTAQTLFNLAQAALSLRQWQEALRYAQQARLITHGLKWLEPRLHFLLADAHAGLGLEQESLRARARAFALLFPKKAPLFELVFEDHRALRDAARARGDKREEARQLLFLAHGQSKAVDLRSYLACYEQAFALYRELGDMEKLAEQLVVLGVGLALYRPGRLRGKRARALGYWRVGLALRRQQAERREITERDRQLTSCWPDPPSLYGEEKEQELVIGRWGETAFLRAWRASEQHYHALMASFAPLPGGHTRSQLDCWEHLLR